MIFISKVVSHKYLTSAGGEKSLLTPTPHNMSALFRLQNLVRNVTEVWLRNREKVMQFDMLSVSERKHFTATYLSNSGMKMFFLSASQRNLSLGL